MNFDHEKMTCPTEKAEAFADLFMKNHLEHGIPIGPPNPNGEVHAIMAWDYWLQNGYQGRYEA